MARHCCHRYTRVETSLDLSDLLKKSLDILGLDSGPLPDFSQVLVIVSNVAFYLLFQIGNGRKVPPLEDVLGEYTEPDFNGVEPATVFGCVNEADTMIVITEIGLSGLHALENAPFAFFT